MDLVEKVKILNNYLAVKNYKKVIESCVKILKKIPNNTYILNLTGLAYQGLNQHKNSISYFQEAIKFDPNNIATLNNLANSLKALGDLKNSKLYFEKIFNINPNYINACNNYANLKIIINDYKGAIELFNRALNLVRKNEVNQTSIKSKSINILFSLALAYQSVNQIEKAKKTIEEILYLEPNHAGAHKLLSSIIKYSVDSKDSLTHLKQMEKILSDNKNDKEKTIDLSFALGKAFDDLGDYDSAYSHTLKANQLKLDKSGSNILSEDKLIKNIISTFKEINIELSHKKEAENKIIFICGMPRSGTTLVEQIISSHNKVYGAGELIYLYEIIKKNFLEDNKLNKQKIISLQNQQSNLVAREYIDYLKLYNLSEKIITDKAPQNFLWIGFIKIFFPNSKVIHCFRNPKDNCLSLFKNSFAASMMNWSYNQEDIAKYYNLYSELMQFWKKKIPNFIFDLEYESLVKNKDVEIKKILEFCELEIDEKCFDHQKNSKTPIKTVSISQARQPIYSSSVNLNSKYDKFLEKMFNLLNKN